jgi:hypothetical protein
MGLNWIFAALLIPFLIHCGDPARVVPKEDIADAPMQEPAMGVPYRLHWALGDGSMTLEDAGTFDFFDQQTQKRCRLVPVSPTELRCIPTPARLSEFYGDSFCSQPVLLDAFNGCTRLPDYALVRAEVQDPLWTSLGEPVVNVFSRGGPIAASPQIYARTETGACVARGGGPLGATWYALTPQDTQIFAEGTLGEEIGDASHVSRHVVTLEGNLRARRFFGSAAHDRDEDFDCHFEEVSEGTQRCVPDQRLVPVPVFSDVSCTNPSLAAPVYDVYPSVAQVDDRFYRIELGLARNFYQGDVAMCTDMGPRAPITLDKEILLQTALRTRRGEGRIQRRIVSSDGLEISSDIYDTETQAPCASALGSDAKLHCVTEHADATTVYLDSACRQPALATFTADASTKYTRGVEGCGVVTVRTLGSIVSPAPAQIYVFDAFEGCIEVPSIYDVFTPGPRADAALFPLIPKSF